MEIEKIKSIVQTVRGHKVILDCDLALIYGVPTKALNQAVKRNADRFPEDFLFQLTPEECTLMRRQFGTASSAQGMRSRNVTASKRNVRYLPYVFTEYGAVMAANILNSKPALRMSIYVVRAFCKIKEAALADRLIEKRLAEIEKNLLGHDLILRDLYEKIKPLLLPGPEAPKRRIGFHANLKDIKAFKRIKEGKRNDYVTAKNLDELF